MARENFKSKNKNKVEFSGTILVLWILGAILSFMIGLTILSYGFFNVVIYLLISAGISTFVLPLVSNLIKSCRTNIHIYAEVVIRLVFYMMFRQLPFGTLPSTVMMYMVGYFVIWIVSDLAISFTMC